MVKFQGHIKIMGHLGVFGSWGEVLFIFRELGSTGNYISGAGEQAHSLAIKGALPKSKKYFFLNLTLKEKPLFFRWILGTAPTPPPF